MINSAIYTHDHAHILLLFFGWGGVRVMDLHFPRLRTNSSCSHCYIVKVSYVDVDEVDAEIHTMMVMDAHTHTHTHVTHILTTYSREQQDTCDVMVNNSQP